MDKIYRYAWLTTVALDGRDAEAGLAGISRPLSLTSQPELHGNAVKLRDFIAEKMTAPQIAEAQKLAADWKPTSTQR